MITMKEAAAAYNKRYYGSKGVETLYKINGNFTNKKAFNESVELTATLHDMGHLISSGVLNVKATNFDDSFKIFEDTIGVERLVGAKAELLQHIYNKAFGIWDANKGKDLFSERNSGQVFDIMKQDTLEYFKHNTVPLMQEMIGNVKTDGSYSHIPKLDSLIASYKDMTNPKLEDFFSDEDIKFHTEKAGKFYQRLEQTHPECFVDGKIEYENMMNLDVRECCINNLSAVEVNKLRGGG